jgi:hypothetical protein
LSRRGKKFLKFSFGEAFNIKYLFRKISGLVAAILDW